MQDSGCTQNQKLKAHQEDSLQGLESGEVIVLSPNIITLGAN
jgi:hypothetical protein